MENMLDLSLTAFDIDGVVADVITPFLRLLEERHGFRFDYEDVTDFDLARALKIPDWIVEDLLIELFERPVEIGARPYPGAVETLSAWGREQALLFVTSRSKPEPITGWLQSVMPDLFPDGIEVVATGDPMTKLDCLMDRGKLYFVDDHPATCIMLAQAGLKPLVFDQPWNRKVPETIPRVRNWVQLEAAARKSTGTHSDKELKQA